MKSDVHHELTALRARVEQREAVCREAYHVVGVVGGPSKPTAHH